MDILSTPGSWNKHNPKISKEGGGRPCWRITRGWSSHHGDSPTHGFTQQNLWVQWYGHGSDKPSNKKPFKGLPLFHTSIPYFSCFCPVHMWSPSNIPIEVIEVRSLTCAVALSIEEILWALDALRPIPLPTWGNVGRHAHWTWQKHTKTTLRRNTQSNKNPKQWWSK